MKLPTVCLAATFAGGVALGLFTSLANLNTSVTAIRAGFVLATVLLVLSAILVRQAFARIAGCISLSAWLVLGSLAAFFGVPAVSGQSRSVTNLSWTD